MIQKGLFREDLFFRLNVFQIDIPPLRERPEDLENLLNHMMKASVEKAGRELIQFTPSSIKILQKYSWPGNLRELRNIVERITYLHESDIFDQADVKDYLSFENKRKESIQDEGPYIQSVLDDVNENRSQAAKLLGISRSALYRKLEQYGLK
ncbi:helix-turn-helix domain-containing protein [Siminovitchia sp. 179-K 8D1 HS]|uniref:helix-turn-helix domain-containing protein n=1 Tax=Siminovitchia sp. 179-K 8D1 HS TaxID=3142385 RepID=UPI00399EEDC1